MRIPELPRGLPESGGHRGGVGRRRLRRAQPPERGGSPGERQQPARCPPVSPSTRTLTPRPFLGLPVAAPLAGAGGIPRRPPGLRGRGLVVSRLEESAGSELHSPYPVSGGVSGRLLHLFASGCDFWGAAGDLLGALSRACGGREASPEPREWEPGRGWSDQVLRWGGILTVGGGGLGPGETCWVRG